MRFKAVVLLIAIVSVIMGGTAVYIHHRIEPMEINVYGLIAECTQQELILNSDIIVKGTVASLGDGKWSNPDLKIEGKNNIIQTDIIVSIEELISGDYDKNDVVVRIGKGFDKESNTKVISEGYPDFEVGEEVVLFLSRDDGEFATREDYFVLTGMRQGKWSLDASKRLILPEGTDYALEHQGIDALEAEIRKQQASHPDWKAKKEIEKERIKKQNIELFGE